MTAARIYWPALQRAADLIRQRGWCQRRGETRDGRICAAYAIGLARGSSNGSLRHFAAHIGTDREVVYPASYIAAWQDRRSCTKRKVLAALERAARTP